MNLKKPILRQCGGMTLAELVLYCGMLTIVSLFLSTAILYVTGSLRKYENQNERNALNSLLRQVAFQGVKQVRLPRFDLSSTFRENAGTYTAIDTVSAPKVEYQWDVAALRTGEPALGAYFANFAAAKLDVKLDSSTLEMFQVKTDVTGSPTLNKAPSSLVVSRCIENTAALARDTLPTAFASSPRSAAIWVLGALDRRPFVQVSGAGLVSVNCCKVDDANCAEDVGRKWLPRVFRISLDATGLPTSVEFYPQTAEQKSVWSVGILMTIENAAEPKSFTSHILVQENLCGSKNTGVRCLDLISVRAATDSEWKAFSSEMRWKVMQWAGEVNGDLSTMTVVNMGK